MIYSNTRDTNWKFPDLWYSFSIEKSANLSMKFIMIDTMIMMGARDTENLPNFDTINYQKLQDEWFEKEVASCESTYCIVVG